jgi:hypothetical protein
VRPETAAVPVPFRCSTASQELTEPLEGTASTVRAFVLVEAPGPWGEDAVRDSRLPAEVKGKLRELESADRVRPLLIRRRSRGVGTGARIFAAHVHSGRPWLETALLDHVRDVLDLDLSKVGVGESPGLTPHEEPLFLVCTHGKHDACCAERGRPLYAAVTEAAPEHSWEVSHIGGDRFAANLLVLPFGLYYGRLVPADVPGFVEQHLDGRLDVEHLRGRSSYPFSVQAAEIYLRRHIGVTSITPLPLEDHDRRGTETRAVFAVEGPGDGQGAARQWEVRVHTEIGPPRRLTCRAASASNGFSHRLLGIREL